MENKISPRQQTLIDLIEWLQDSGRWTAPYGILNSLGPKNMYRSITFGIARYLDAECRIYGPKKIMLRTSRSHGQWVEFNSLDALKRYLNTEI